ncbi:hypothetical protein LO767_03715 [Halopseudomonas aestusnigri]|uniref:hypothetical protein n=1 Tax=Halopseudomonas aestusnigri TaxID=857252 RepID=UPI001E3CD310|nr:hypothetical protein [Halopseudomonas aestusnigri]UGV31620.1 hypothetical protein LO767_03715 [Halopseudomonas aestusnigri]
MTFGDGTSYGLLIVSTSSNEYSSAKYSLAHSQVPWLAPPLIQLVIKTARTRFASLLSPNPVRAIF